MTESDSAGSRSKGADRELPADATFAQVCEITLPRLYGFLRAQVASREVAKELLGRVFVKAASRWADRACDDTTVHWLFRTARTTVIDYWRVEGRAQRVNVPLDELKTPASSASNPEEAYASKERHAVMLTAMSDLSDDDRSLLALKFAGQRTNRDIARILNVSEAAVSMRLLRAIKKLRERLDRMGVA